MFKLVSEEAEKSEIKLPTSTGSSKKQESPRKTSISALLTMPKPLTVWITTNCGQFLKRWEYQTAWPASWEICVQVKKHQLELDMEQQAGSKLGKEYGKAWLEVEPYTAWALLSLLFSHSVMSSSLRPAHQASLSFTISWSLLKLMSIESVIPSNHLILCHPLLLLPSAFPSIRVSSNESALCVRWPKYWIFSFSISPSNEDSGLISFRIDLFDLLAVQGTLKSLLQHHSSKASILWCSAFFMIQLSHLYMTTGKTIALTTWTFIDKVMSLLLHILSKLGIAFLPKSKHLLISWLQSWSTLILKPKKIKSVIVSPSVCHEITGPDAMILVFWMLSFKPTFPLSTFIFIKKLFSSSSLSAIRVVSSAAEVVGIFPDNLDSSLCFIQPSILHDVLYT